MPCSYEPIPFTGNSVLAGLGKTGPVSVAMTPAANAIALACGNIAVAFNTTNASVHGVFGLFSVFDFAELRQPNFQPTVVTLTEQGLYLGDPSLGAHLCRL